MAWEGHILGGSAKNRLSIIPEDADFKDAFEISYAMEEGLQRLYKLLAHKSDNDECIAMLEKLADFEKRHKEELIKIASKENGISLPAEESVKVLLEGGFDMDETLRNISAEINDLLGIADLAMALEAQAYDFYVNLASSSKIEETKEFFLRLADEEKNHLAYILREFRQGLS